MIDQEYIDLMNQELDGENTASGSRKLAEYLATHPAAREYFGELQDALQIFQKVPLIDPPRGLLDAVMASVGPDAAPAVRPRPAAPAPARRADEGGSVGIARREARPFKGFSRSRATTPTNWLAKSSRSGSGSKGSHR